MKKSYYYLRAQGGNMNLQKANDYTKKLFNTNWVKWVHEGSKPAESNAEKGANVLIGALSKHCAMCLNLNGCCFVVDKCPPKPLHPNCHCYTIDIPSITAKAECPIEKIRDYIFSDLKSNGKKELFESWGYSVDDAHWLQEEIERQGRANYLSGNYTLGKLNLFGQRLNIRVEIPRKDGQGVVSFITGWTARPHGEIKLNTPYGGA